MKAIIKKIIPRWALSAYHKTLAMLAAFWYHHPSNKLIVIGVTGTHGKSTTVNLIGRMLVSSGKRVGWTSTINFRVGDKEWLNDTKMTMLGRFALQRLLARMVRAGCQYAIIETSSEGLVQSRHLGINYDVAVFLNILPHDHLEAHGGFENYKRAKTELFCHLTRYSKKRIVNAIIPKVSVVNLDAEHASDFISFAADKKIGYTILKNPNDKIQMTNVNETVAAHDVVVESTGSSFVVDGERIELHIRGGWNVSHALAAISVGKTLGLPITTIQKGLASVEQIPGRLEFIDVGQDFAVVVDYAPQAQAVAVLYDFLNMVPHKRIIHVFGSTGGGRDKDRRSMLGRLAAANADIVIATDEDPYDDDPMEIINAIAAGALAAGKKEGENFFRILDRREAIQKAVALAQAGDIVVLTGKGCEQAMVVKNLKKIPWDDREEARQAIRARRV